MKNFNSTKQHDLLTKSIIEKFKNSFPHTAERSANSLWFVLEIYDYPDAEPITTFRLECSDAHEEYYKSCQNANIRLVMMGAIRWHLDGDKVCLQVSQKNETHMYNMGAIYVSV